MSDSEFFWGTGRRKTSVARVRIQKGTGDIKINKHSLEEYFPVVTHRQEVLAPFLATNTMGKYDIMVNVKGGGPTGQAGAVLLGIARGLCLITPSLEEKLRANSYLTRDSRMSERKKYGKRKARASYQFSKR